jgi:hypothetical protein
MRGILFKLLTAIILLMWFLKGRLYRMGFQVQSSVSVTVTSASIYPPTPSANSFTMLLICRLGI